MSWVLIVCSIPIGAISTGFDKGLIGACNSKLLRKFLKENLRSGLVKKLCEIAVDNSYSVVH